MKTLKRKPTEHFFKLPSEQCLAYIAPAYVYTNSAKHASQWGQT